MADEPGLDTEIDDNADNGGEPGGEELAEIEVDVQGILDQMRAGLKAAETHRTLPAGVQIIAATLDKIAVRLAEEVAYKANLDDLPDGDDVPADPGVIYALTTAQQVALSVLTEVWLPWLPQIVATGDPALLRLASEVGRAIHDVIRAMLPSMGIPAAEADAMMAETAPLYPRAPLAGNGVGRPGATA